MSHDVCTKCTPRGRRFGFYTEKSKNRRFGFYSEKSKKRSGLTLCARGHFMAISLPFYGHFMAGYRVGPSPRELK